MQRPHRQFRRRGGGGGRHGGDAGQGARQPQPNSQPPVDYGQNFFFQNQAPYGQFPPQSYPFNPYFQNPNLHYHDPNLYLQQLASSTQHPGTAPFSSRVDDSRRLNLLTPTPQQNPNLPAQNQSPALPTRWQNQQRNLLPGNVASSSTAGEFPRPHSSIPRQNPNLAGQNQNPKLPTQQQPQQQSLLSERREPLEKISLIPLPGNVASSSTVGEFPRPHSSIPRQNPNLAGQNQNPKLPTQQQPQQQSLLPERREPLEKIDAAVQQARRDLIASAEHVSTWKVSQLALVKLEAESWDSLGVQLQQVPSLKSLIGLEGKINAFIQCFVAVRTVTSLYDMEVAIGKNEGIGNFEVLELGPLVRHPLIEHYFSSKDMTEIYKITGEDIISYLKMFIIKAKGKSFQGDEFLIFIAQMCGVRWELMGLRIPHIGWSCIKLAYRKVSRQHLLSRGSYRPQPLCLSGQGRHIGFIRKALHREGILMKTCKGKGKQYGGKGKGKQSGGKGKGKQSGGKGKGKGKQSVGKSRNCPLFSLKKQRIDERFYAITQRMFSFSFAHKDFRGKHIRFTSSSSDDDEDESDGEHKADDIKKQKDYPFSSQKRSDKVSSCLYPSAEEEMPSLGLRGEVNCFFPSTCTLKEDYEPARKRRKLYNLSVSFKNQTYQSGADLALADDSMRSFITKWKKACRRHTITEVMSIRNGHLDSIYGTFQPLDDPACTNVQNERESFDIEQSIKGLPDSDDLASGVTVEDIIRKIAEYFASENVLSGDGNALQTMIVLARKLLQCEVWLNQRFSVKKFDSLGYGDYFTFLERHVSLLPNVLNQSLKVGVHDQFCVEASLLRHQLIVLLSQASESLWEDGIISKQRISSLLSRQFPFVNFSVVESGCLDNFRDTIKEQKSSIPSNCVLFSATLLGTGKDGDSMCNSENFSLDSTSLEPDTCRKVEAAGSFTAKDVVDALVRAPMLIDLSLLLHWDSVYAPSLGPLLRWLLTEVNTKDLLCLLTRDGKIIRIDPSASMDSFLKALCRGSPFAIAVELVSLFALFGGSKHLPLSLLKCHARRGFEVLLTSQMDRWKSSDWDRLSKEKASMIKGNTTIGKCIMDNVEEDMFHASRIVLECLGFVPSEFRSLAADILLSGLQSVVKYAPASILQHCKSKEDHLMLHDIGFILGITEWIDDHWKVCPIDQSWMPVAASPLNSLCSEAVASECHEQLLSRTLLPQEIPSAGDDRGYEKLSNFGSSVDDLEIDISAREGIQDAVAQADMKDAALIIESIRREEFGLGSDVESGMLKKQHARLGRALHCLSHELYSQDSHFFLELIQNADDNAYHKDVEPTLMFILQNSRIIVLNNERGFTFQNIKALCDVGNSTKKGSSSGYIGQKGIGFKSVFRVTDAPEIHSNGFHIKFDITKGQIGSVLPTIVPPCDSDFIRQLTSACPVQVDDKLWNTCIVLPFRSRVTQGLEMNKIISMLSEVHPSLLLFLHRLQCIKLVNMLDNTFYTIRKETVGDGLVKVSYGESMMTWFMASKKLHAEILRPGVQATEISIAFTLRESENGKHEPHMGQQPVFAFLPLRTYGLKFILQGDFVLPSSREEVDSDSPWNQWLLSEFPDLFVSAEKSFSALPCFRENPGKAVAAYMHFVPLMGEVQGFFYGLPRMIISRLRQSDCLLEDGCNRVWVPPCKVLRSWNERARVLLSDVLLREHLGLSFLHRDIILSDPLAQALGIQDYGPKILIQLLSSICCAENGLKLMGLHWLSSWLNELHDMLHLPGKATENASLEMDLISSLRKIPFIPLSDGTYGSINEGTIWLSVDSITTGLGGDGDYKAFPRLYTSLRIVNPDLLSPLTDNTYCADDNCVNNTANLLHKIGAQHLTAHQIIKAHVLPIISDDKFASRDKSLVIECYAFVMLHFQSSCADCHIEKEGMISELCIKAFLLTNHGFKRATEVAIHFGKDFGSFVDAGWLIGGIDYKWHEIDAAYLKHPLPGSISFGLMKWRDFFLKLGITDFVKVTRVERTISDVSPIILQQLNRDKELVTSESLVIDWESEELVSILSSLRRNENQEKSKYLLGVLDALWDEYFGDKTACLLSRKSGEDRTSFKSTLMNAICDACWVTSSMDAKLHYPRDLFHDCEAVRSILGTSAPFAVPKIRSNKLLTDIGFKTQVTIDDILMILEKWRGLKPFMASISQMSKLYTLIFGEIKTSKEKVLESLCSGPFIFVPSNAGVSRGDVVAGSLLSPEEVYWHDRSGASADVKKLKSLTADLPMGKLLCNIYPSLHDFFVGECGVNETPPFRCYLQSLKQLSMSMLPHQGASAVFHVFLRWSDGLRSGAMVDDDIVYLRDHLLQLDFAVLPAMQNKWVSLHPSFGLICWSDDDSLKKQFKHMENIELLYFGELTNKEKEMLQSEVSVLMQKLGVPALSEVVTREAIYYGLSDSSFKASLVAWALPYTQRYIYTVHSEKYSQLKLSGYKKLQQLKIVAVEKLFYRNVVKKCGISSNKRAECSCLLQDAVLYATHDSDSHSLFMELSRLFFHGVPELHLANFLHMLTTMAESGSTEEQMDLFILNSQKMPKIPDEEPVWSLPPQFSNENDHAIRIDETSTSNDLNSLSKSKNKKPILRWPPAGWKTAPGFNYGSRGSVETDTSLDPGEGTVPIGDPLPTETDEDDLSEDEVSEIPPIDDVIILDASCIPEDQTTSGLEQVQSLVESHYPEDGSSKSTETNHRMMTRGARQAVLAGRQGELVAFKHFKDKHGTEAVNWVNEHTETGLPYDIVIGEKGNNMEFIEVKASRYVSKNWFNISTREWQFAVEKGNRYSIAYILLSKKRRAKVTIYKNPVKLCRFGRLDLAVMMRK